MNPNKFKVLFYTGVGIVLVPTLCVVASISWSSYKRVKSDIHVEKIVIVDTIKKIVVITETKMKIDSINPTKVKSKKTGSIDTFKLNLLTKIDSLTTKPDSIRLINQKIF